MVLVKIIVEHPLPQLDEDLSYIEIEETDEGSGYDEEEVKCQLFSLLEVQPEFLSLDYIKDSSPPIIFVSISFNRLGRNEIQMKNRLSSYLKQVQEYEDGRLQIKANNVIPHDRLIGVLSSRPEDVNTRDYPKFLNTDEDERRVLQELLKWFKHDFFTWMNNAPCENCDSKETKSAGMAPPSEEDSKWGASRVETYFCSKCCHVTRFPRYNKTEKLLESRKGRCGEWANCFCLILRSMGFPTRYVIDFTDHVWSEVWLKHSQRYVHLDSCEAKLDGPLLYEAGWGKKLNYTFSISVEDGITDTIWRYTRKWDDVKTRRTMVNEDFLTTLIELLNNKHVSKEPHSKARIREDIEKEELNNFKEQHMTNSSSKKEREVNEEEKDGRLSGDKEWRRARGELGEKN